MKKSGHKEIRGGCFQCDDYSPRWTRGNVRDAARRHAKARDHSTWVEVINSTTYNPEAEFRKGTAAQGNG